MSETISFRDVKLEGGWLMVKPEREDLGKAMALVRKHTDRLYDMDVKEHRKKRSLDANAYAWVLIHKLAAAMGMHPVEVYRLAIRDVGDNCTTMCVREKDVSRFIKSWESIKSVTSFYDISKDRLRMIIDEKRSMANSYYLIVYQ